MIARFKVELLRYNILLRISKYFSLQSLPNVVLEHYIKQPSFIQLLPRVFTGIKKPAPFWLGKKAGMHHLSNRKFDDRCLDSEDGRFMVMSL
jgi:hypothetical protein